MKFNNVLVEIEAEVGYYHGFADFASWAKSELKAENWIFVSDNIILMWGQDIPNNIFESDEIIGLKPFKQIIEEG